VCNLMSVSGLYHLLGFFHLELTDLIGFSDYVECQTACLWEIASWYSVDVSLWI